MVSTRLPRFARSPAIRPLHLTERDRDIIRLVARHRFLRSTHVTTLAGGSAQQILRRLQLLYHHGFLERPEAQLFNHYYKQGCQSFVYGLGNKAAPLLGLGQDQVCRVRLAEKNTSVRHEYLEHALLVSDVMVALEIACRQSGRASLIYEDDFELPAQIPACKPPARWRVNLENGMELGVIPDCIFALQFTDRNGTAARTLFCLEADRGTMPVFREGMIRSSFMRKLLAYEATWRENVHQTHFGFGRLRVIVLTTGPKRLKSIMDACLHLNHGQGLFLFADNSVLKNPQVMLSSIWQTAKGSQNASLLD
jgi:hypothetical protein